MSVRKNGEVIAGGGTKDMLTQKNITNCITEIPQDIKLELNNGTLTLKAGSKVYVPNGVGVFDTVTIASDLTVTNSDNDKRFIVLLNGVLATFGINNCYSGTTAPSGQQYMLWYDTANNLIKFTADSGSTWTTNNSLTLGVITTNSSQITSIDQVFNGFGYIGLTVFALPGVKGLIPNGRNTDGTLSNTVFTVDSVKTIGYAATYNDYTISLSASLVDIWVAGRLVYDEQTNHNVNTQNNSVQTITICGKVSCDGTRITSFEPIWYPFKAVDYSDTEYMAHQSMPSSRYNSLTVGASGTTYTAPADGWFYLSAKTSGTNYQVLMATGYMSVSFRSNSLNQRMILPVAKGMVMTLNYDGTLSDTTFRFIYAQGAK